VRLRARRLASRPMGWMEPLASAGR
jgi:hypothetical protein